MEKLIPLLSLPRNWIIGPQGVISYEQHGYYVEPEQWLTRRVIERMESLK